MSRKIAEFISYVFHPLLLSTALMIILFLFSPNVLRPLDASNVLPILAMVFAITFVIPVLSIGMLKLTSSITSMKLEDRKERIMPFVFISAYYSLTVYMFTYKLVLSQTMIVLFGTVTAVIILLTVITIFFKISVHAAGIWGVLGSMVAIHIRYPDSLLFWPIVFTLLLAGIVNSSRLYLKVHSPAEVGFGSLLGFITCFTSIYLFT